MNNLRIIQDQLFFLFFFLISTGHEGNLEGVVREWNGGGTLRGKVVTDSSASP